MDHLGIFHRNGSVWKRLRPFLETNPDIAGAVLRIFMRAVRTTLRRTSPGAPHDAQLGALTFIHRFGSALNTHFHRLARVPTRLSPAHQRWGTQADTGWAHAAAEPRTKVLHRSAHIDIPSSPSHI
jgi:hypothetical protein